MTRLAVGLILVTGVAIPRVLAALPSAASGGAVTPAAVRHAQELIGGWSFAETTNFRLWHQGSRPQAEEVLRTAELARARAYLRWFGEPAPAWQPPCELNLYPSGAAYQTATGLPDRTPGFAQTLHDGERVVSRRIDLRGDWPELLTTVLPHEVTHIVLSDQFGSYRLPCWIDEGIAVLSEPPENIARHLHRLPRYRDEGLLISVQTLVEKTDYPERRFMGPFYAQSVSLVQFLEKEKGSQALIAFLRCARRASFEPALRRHYQMNFAELEQRWQEHAFRDQLVKWKIEE